MDEDDRPAWARRLRAERDARRWSQRDAVRALRAHATRELPGEDALLRRWKAWEKGDNQPDDFYRPLIARTFGTVAAAFFALPGRRDGNREILAVTGMDTHDIVSRLRASDVDGATLDALRVTVDRLCSEYPYAAGEQLLVEGRRWLHHVAEIQSRRLTLGQYREILDLAGWLALLVGCVEYDLGQRSAAETTRRAALSLGTDAGDTAIIGWAHEMRAWMALTAGDHRSVIAAARAGTEIARGQDVTVQLAAQEAKAWARVGDRRQTEVALDRGRRLLESLEPPANLDHHFVVDPSKFDFYAMDAYRVLGEDRLAETCADEVIRVGTDVDGSERRPMRVAEARITRGVVAARDGDVERAVAEGERALQGARKSLPSLLMVSRELGALVRQRFARHQDGRAYLDHLHDLARADGGGGDGGRG